MEGNLNQIEFKEVSKKEKIFSIIESLLFTSGEPLKLRDISAILDMDKAYIKKILEEMIISYSKKSSRGIKIVNMNDKYQLTTKSENNSFIQKLLKTNSRQSLSQAALETLSIITFKQPVTRVEIDEIRGVKSDRAVISLLEKGLIKEAGRKDAVGRPILYETTDEFLKYFDFSSLDDLPQLEDIVKEFEDKE